MIKENNLNESKGPQWWYIICLIFPLLLTSVSGCNRNEKSVDSLFHFDTDSDSARYYFTCGWKKIMDEGRWTDSEIAFRKAVTFDPDFVLGKILVGRISRDLEEREMILKEVETNQKQLSKEGNLLYEMHRMSVEFMNYRATGIEIPAAERTLRDSISFHHRRKFIDLYPNEPYEKAEYIEVIHHKLGAQSALDTLQSIATQHQLELPFYISYQAMLLSELGYYNEAFLYLDRLDSILDDNAPARYYTRGIVMMNMDSIASANVMVQQAYQLDTNHLLAKGLLERLK